MKQKFLKPIDKGILLLYLCDINNGQKKLTYRQRKLLIYTVQLRRVDGKIFSEKIILGYLDLSKFATLKPGQLKDMQFTDRQEKWGYSLANIGQMELQDLSQEDEIQFSARFCP